MQTLIGILLGLLIFTTTAQGANEYVVIASDRAGASYTPGAQLSAGQSIKLEGGARVTLLSKSGGVVKLKGPYSGVLPSASSSDGDGGTIDKIAKLVARNAKRSRTLGATRAGSGASRPDKIWLANVGRTRHVCAKPDSALLWRRRAKSPAAITIAAQGKKAVSLIWQAGKQTLTLPPTSVRDNAEITIIAAGRTLKVKLHVAPSGIDFDNRTEVLAWMAGHDCADQAGELIRQLHAG